MAGGGVGGLSLLVAGRREGDERCTVGYRSFGGLFGGAGARRRGDWLATGHVVGANAAPVHIHVGCPCRMSMSEFVGVLFRGRQAIVARCVWPQGKEGR